MSHLAPRSAAGDQSAAGDRSAATPGWMTTTAALCVVTVKTWSRYRSNPNTALKRWRYNSQEQDYEVPVSPVEMFVPLLLILCLGTWNVIL